LFVLGLVLTFFYKKIIEIQGKSKNEILRKYDLTEKERKIRLKIGGIVFLLASIISFFRSL
jgi:hypothetical protein